ncbi:MAG: hypothetical protein NTY34_06705 [Candidatus Omnitrophica bacterium]|nr:hypothetical protein [Candidatus Omnitrophota bacterium]
MRKNKLLTALYALSIVCLLSSCAFTGRDVNLVDAKIAAAIDEKLMPVGITDAFPKGTSKVSCWIKWRDAKINTPLLAKWHYVTDDVHILDYTFYIPKKEGTGSVSLTMPAEKKFPSGRYKLDLVTGNRVIRSLIFRVE